MDDIFLQQTEIIWAFLVPFSAPSFCCSKHFHTSNHASDHPRKALVTNQGALDQQQPAFEEVGKICFDRLMLLKTRDNPVQYFCSGGRGMEGIQLLLYLSYS